MREYILSDVSHVTFRKAELPCNDSRLVVPGPGAGLGDSTRTTGQGAARGARVVLAHGCDYGGTVAARPTRLRVFLFVQAVSGVSTGRQ